MATEIEDCHKLIAAVRRSGKHLEMAQQVRWAPYVLAPKALALKASLATSSTLRGVFPQRGGLSPWAKWRAYLALAEPLCRHPGRRTAPVRHPALADRRAFTEVSAYGNKPAAGALDRDADDFQVALFKAPGRDGCVAKVAVSSGLARPYCLYLSLYGTRGTWERNRLQAPGADTSEDYLFLRKIPNLREMVKLSTPARATTISPG